MKRVAPTSVMPIGKYKGQPIEAMAQDKSYLEWLQTQDWFRERYSGIYTLIVNNFSEASETPDHNALQVLFLDNMFCERFVTLLMPQWRASRVKQLLAQINGARRRIAKRMAEIERGLSERKAGGESLSDYARKREEERTAEAKKDLQLFGGELGKFANIHWEMSFGRSFEEKGIDVRLSGGVHTIESLPHIDQFHRLDAHKNQYFNDHDYFCVEIKPQVSDDYPAVLRQMRANGSKVLFTEAYTGVGATEDQFVKTFAISQIKVVFRRDVDAVVLDSGPQCGQLEIGDAQ